MEGHLFPPIIIANHTHQGNEEAVVSICSLMHIFILPFSKGEKSKNILHKTILCGWNVSSQMPRSIFGIFMNYWPDFLLLLSLVNKKFWISLPHVFNFVWSQHIACVFSPNESPLLSKNSYHKSVLSKYLLNWFISDHLM